MIKSAIIKVTVGSIGSIIKVCPTVWNGDWASVYIFSDGRSRNSYAVHWAVNSLSNSACFINIARQPCEPIRISQPWISCKAIVWTNVALG